MENSILIFRTSITRKQDIKRVGTILNKYSQIKRWNVDFEDWEKILRIECNGINSEEITQALREVNIWAIELE